MWPLRNAMGLDERKSGHLARWRPAFFTSEREERGSGARASLAGELAASGRPLDRVSRQEANFSHSLELVTDTIAHRDRVVLFRYRRRDPSGAAFPPEKLHRARNRVGIPRSNHGAVVRDREPKRKRFEAIIMADELGLGVAILGPSHQARRTVRKRR